MQLLIVVTVTMLYLSSCQCNYTIFMEETTPSNLKSKISCDDLIQSNITKTGTFWSPLYPHPYPPMSHCKYTFHGINQETVQINFEDLQLYRSNNHSSGCVGMDSITVYEFNNDGRKYTIDTLCASQNVLPIMSNGPLLVLEFVSVHKESSESVKGYKANYKFIKNFGMTSGHQINSHECVFTFSSLDSQNGTFSSPNFPGPYPRNTECHYIFHGNENERIYLNFTYFDIDGIYPCDDASESDFVEMSNFKTEDRKFVRICGRINRFSVQSDKSFFRIFFRSNSRLDGKGFQANYRFINDTHFETATSKYKNENFKGAGDGLKDTQNIPVPLSIFRLFLVYVMQIAFYQ